jgi:tetratricopeptide (TPR) repeat protein/AraC-like DNA-binding protein
MSEALSHNNGLISKLTSIVLLNLDNENFKVNELVKESGISRSSLSRKLQASTGKTINQFIREIRLHEALKLLQKGELTANEVAFRTGFGSATYFNSCFSEYFGYPPGKAKRGAQESYEAENIPDIKATAIKSDLSGKRHFGSYLYIIIPALFLIIAGFVIYQKYLRKNYSGIINPGSERISVVVMPFQNMTRDTTMNFWEEMIQMNLISSLSNSSGDLKVIQSESILAILKNRNVTNLSSITPSISKDITQKFNAEIFVNGNINLVGEKIIVNAQLIDTKTQEVFKSFRFESSPEKIMLAIDSLSAEIKDYLLITLLKKDNKEFQKVTATHSPLAYKYFILGKNARYESDYPAAVKWLTQAVEIDSNFTWAMRFIATSYAGMGMYDEAKKWCNKVYNKRDMMNLEEKLYTEMLYAEFFQTPYEVIKSLKELDRLDNESPPVHYNLGGNYRYLHQYDKAISEYRKALDIYNKWGSRPLEVEYYTVLGQAYHKTGQYKKEKNLYRKALEDFPDDEHIIRLQAILALTENNQAAGEKYIEKYTDLLKQNSASELSIMTSRAEIYDEGGAYGKAEEYYEKAISLKPDDSYQKYLLARFLINKDRNITRGIGLIDSLLKVSPDDYRFLHSYGRGLYKQGKTREALGVLQKSWDIRLSENVYNHEEYLLLEEVKKAATGLK